MIRPPIQVTKTFLPPKAIFDKYTDQIWNSKILTNQGPLVKEFEDKQKLYLDVENFHFVTNGTLALQLALKSLDITMGEVITTPFSYVATTSAILWERCEPVFVDIDPKTLCMDPHKIEKAITHKTKAILPVHVFGNACDVELIEEIAKRHKLKIIYDGAHAFGSELMGKSLLSYGDITICSFHATKPFHTIEGGCIIPRQSDISQNIDLLKRFGHTGDNHYQLGINAKASEFQAAMGLANLEFVEKIISGRQKVASMYDRALGGTYSRPIIAKDLVYNYAYYPIIFESEEQLLIKKTALEGENIHPRRYFYPSLNLLPYLKSKQSCPISEDISKRILCLPMYEGLKREDMGMICDILLKK